ncbi:MAG: hypothetical protein HYT37_02830 [Candidatus Sungbacteria bacterium]|nr:hypothetical protein [Candidatus Sungbacteria bacterium]
MRPRHTLFATIGPASLHGFRALAEKLAGPLTNSALAEFVGSQTECAEKAATHNYKTYFFSIT